MQNRIEKLVAEFEAIEKSLADASVLADQKKFRELSIRHAELAADLPLFRQYLATLATEKEAAEMLASGDAELQELAAEELKTARALLPELEEQLKIALLPRDPADAKDVIVEVRAGTGGDEAALFAGELARAYLRFAEESGFRTEIIEKSEAEGGGMKEIVFAVRGPGAYARFKWEGGTHRVQRVPATESKGRIHTSAVTVATLPEADEVDVHINPQDLKIDTYCAGGAGGQHVNRTESAVRITHIPTGIVASCQNERSQHQNKLQAMAMLRSRLLAYEQEKAAAERGELRSTMVGSGDRSEKIRTYNFPQDRVTDHRIGENFSNLPGIMAGRLAPIVDALTAADIAEKMRG